MTPERWQKVEELYQAALERDASERGAYLRSGCAGDIEISHCFRESETVVRLFAARKADKDEQGAYWRGNK